MFAVENILRKHSEMNDDRASLKRFYCQICSAEETVSEPQQN